MYADRRIARNTFAAVRARGLDATAVDATVARSPCRLPLEGSSKQTQALWQGIAAGFLDCLSESGVIDLPEPEDPPRPGSLEHLRREHEGWLRGQRGLSASTIRGHSKVFERFMRFRFGDAGICPGPNTVPDIWPSNFRREAANAVLRTQGWHRGLLRYLHATGWNRDDLSWCVARLAHNRPPLSRTLLSANDIQRVRDAARGDTDQARRDYAILLLTARLGLRAPEVVAIRLDDIRWHRGGILICGKGNLHDALPLPVGVGEALADYVRHGRKGLSCHLFVSARAPRGALRSTMTAARLLRTAIQRAGLAPSPGPLGARMLHHSLATAMLHEGASFAELGGMLRHRHRAPTMI